ncbi:MAG: hypothetical protein J5701_06045 [Bacteroidales bacterium]|nr:hypothetical protein [Bacteroidales bacterium]
MKKFLIFIFFVLSVISVKSQELFPDERDSLRSVEIMKYIFENEKSINIEMWKHFKVKFNLKQVNVNHCIDLTGLNYIPDKFCNELAKKHFPEYLDSNRQIRLDCYISQLEISKNLDAEELYKSYLKRLDELIGNIDADLRENNPLDSSQTYFPIAFVSSYYEIKEAYIKIKGGRYQTPGGNGIHFYFLFDDEDKIKDVFSFITLGL